jgi:hypothetical protein
MCNPPFRKPEGPGGRVGVFPSLALQWRVTWGCILAMTGYMKGFALTDAYLIEKEKSLSNRDTCDIFASE